MNLIFPLTKYYSVLTEVLTMSISETLFFKKTSKAGVEKAREFIVQLKYGSCIKSELLIHDFEKEVAASAELMFSKIKYQLCQHFSTVSRGKPKQYIPAALNCMVWNPVLKELQCGATYGLMLINYVVPKNVLRH